MYFNIEPVYTFLTLNSECKPIHKTNQMKNFKIKGIKIISKTRQKDIQGGRISTGGQEKCYHLCLTNQANPKIYCLFKCYS